MDTLTRVYNALRPVVVKALAQAWQVALPILLVGGIAGLSVDVAQTAGVVALSAAITVVANAVRSWRTRDPRLIAVKTALSAGLAVLVAAGSGVWSVSVVDAAVTAALLATASAGLAYGQAVTRS